MKKTLKYIGILLAVYFTVLTCNTLILKKLDEDNRNNLKPFYYEQKSAENNISLKRSGLQPKKNSQFFALPSIEEQYRAEVEKIFDVPEDEEAYAAEVRAVEEYASSPEFQEQVRQRKRQAAIKDVINTVKSMNKKLPLDLGDGRTLVRMDYNELNSIMIYNYKYNESIRNLSQKDINEYKEHWKKEVINVSKNNPNNTHFVTAKVTFIYKLLDRDDIEILKFIITPTEYK